MKKRFTALMAMIMTVGTICMATQIMAAEPSSTTNTVGGAVTFTADWTITEATAWTPFQAISVENLRQDEMTQLDFIACTDLDVNGKFKISAKMDNWTLPNTYNRTHTDAKYKDDTTNTGLSIKVTVDAGGETGTGILATTGTFGSQYTTITNSDAQILTGGSYTTGHVSGVENAQFSVDAKVLIDYKTTVTGTYGNTITLTFAEDATADI
ncbi:hypothetical protein SAMN02746065_10674 [Desulfocicer vacuolatum DSM 3385]|uniref:Uncharacterized protein n=1 Tax=Desulfocicer vacuolatum DSM 3385 TaxID=1121400 RepID=A0A1W2ASP0_9BACT|nr:hypothetical protein [Desulfocicer vacuolatum]SMC63759.1 hypothetical protein SAMN02746065_10674 [Desulfocicer vacuolatum DSM 3385]